MRVYWRKNGGKSFGKFLQKCKKKKRNLKEKNQKKK